MKVLHIMNELRPSGAEVMLELAAPVWMNLGCELHLLALADTPGPQAERLKAAGWKVSHVSRGNGTLKMISRITKAIRVMRPDVVHLHQEGKSLPLCFAVWLAGVPMLRTVHNNFPFTGGLRLRKTLERKLCRLMGSRHVAISSSVRSNERLRFENPTELCWNWFDSSRYHSPTTAERAEARRRLGIPPEYKVLVSMGNGSDIKNYRVAVEAVAAIGDPLLHYYQVGNPHPGGVDAAVARDEGVSGQIHFPGATEAVMDWLWACDLYVMPSMFEGLSIAAAESLAAGCRCLFSNRPGLIDFKEFGIIGHWVEPEADSFTTAIKQEFLKSIAPDQLQKNSEIIRSFFSVQDRSLCYFKLWNDCIKARK